MDVQIKSYTIGGGGIKFLLHFKGDYCIHFSEYMSKTN